MDNTAAQNRLSIFSLVEALRRRKFVIIIPTILLLGAFIAYGHFQKDMYRATASIAAEQTTPPEYLKHVAAPPLNIEDHLYVVRQVLYSESVLQEAAKEMAEYKNVNGPLPSKPIDDLKSAVT